MPDIYLYEGTDVLKNLLGIKERKLLEEAEVGISNTHCRRCYKP